MSARDLARKTCKPCEGGVSPLTPAEIDALLGQLKGWQFEGGAITKSYEFKNYYQTMAFVNAVAWISHREDHHPDLSVHYNRCVVRFSTHDVGGISAKTALAPTISGGYPIAHADMEWQLGLYLGN